MPQIRTEGQEPASAGGAVRFHDAIANEWDAKYRSGGFLKRARFFAAQVLPHVARSGRWLDAGCGSGYFSRVLAEHGLTVTGADASLPMIDAARRLAAGSTAPDALGFEAVETVESLPFADASFDGCICLSVIEYLDNPYACLRELARVMAPGGMLVLSLPHRLAPIRLTQRMACRRFKSMAPANWEYSLLSRNAVTHKELGSMLGRCGFELRKALNFDPAMPAGFLQLVPPSLIFAIAVKQGAPGQAKS